MTSGWGRGDSNSYALRHMILSHARLPIPTLPRSDAPAWQAPFPHNRCAAPKRDSTHPASVCPAHELLGCLRRDTQHPQRSAGSITCVSMALQFSLPAFLRRVSPIHRVRTCTYMQASLQRSVSYPIHLRTVANALRRGSALVAWRSCACKLAWRSVATTDRQRCSLLPEG
jgi:hypothetical protein